MTIGMRARRLLWPKSLAGKAFVSLVFAVVLLVTAWLVALAVVQWRLAAAMKVSEVEFGLPNDLAALLGPPLPPERNAAGPLEEATALMDRWIVASAKETKVGDIAYQFENNPAIQAQAAGPEIDKLLTEADRRPGYASLHLGPPWYKGGIADPFYKRRHLMMAEAYVTRRLEKDGRPSDAVRRALRAIRISRKWLGREPYVHATVDNLAHRTPFLERLNDLLRRHKFPTELHDEIDAELAAQAECHGDLAYQYQVRKLQLLEDFGAHPKRANAWWMVGPVAANDCLFIVDWNNRLMRATRRTFVDVNEEFDAVRKEHARIANDRWESRLHPDALSLMTPHMQQSFDYHLALVRCLRIVNAMAQRGDWTAPLGSLSLPDESLNDPWSDGRLQVKSAPLGPVVYSVGRNKIDDDGDLDFRKDTGFGPEEPPIKFP